MNPFSEVGGTMTYAALGGSIVALAGWMFVAMAKRSNKRAESEGDLDQRAVAMIETATKPFQQVIERQDQIIDEERQEKRRAQDERDKLVSKFIEFSTQTQRENAQQIDKVRDEATQANRRLHDRLDETDRKHTQCEANLREALHRLDKMEQRSNAAAGVQQ